MSKQKLLPEQWAAARNVWEQDARTGYAWLVRELALSVSRTAVAKRAKSEGWTKRAVESPKVTQVTPEVTPVAATMGRPTEYQSVYAEQAYRLMLLGFTREKLAEFFQVNESTIYRWQEKHGDFCEALRKGGAYADAEVALALYDRAKGSVEPDVHVAVIEGEIVTTAIDKHYPPDVGAARMWLKNRQPELWRDKVEVEEKATIALVDYDALDDIYRKALEHAAEVERSLQGRAERLGLIMGDEQGDDYGD